MLIRKNGRGERGIFARTIVKESLALRQWKEFQAGNSGGLKPI
jgi:hypothetical protein